jgi:hypothetical protein
MSMDLFQGHSWTFPGWRPSRGTFSHVLYIVSRGPAKETLCCSTKLVENGTWLEARF